MSQKPVDEKHFFQIQAGAEGRLNGHRFEEIVTNELNHIDFMCDDMVVECTGPNMYYGNPAKALIRHISQDKGKGIEKYKAYWLGGIATSGKGAAILNEAGAKITGSKSDILLEVDYDDGTKETVGVSVKSCSNNAQMALTTASAFCEMLRENDIFVSSEAETGLKMFCGEEGYRPKDGYIPQDITNIPFDRKARPERWYWEELSDSVKQEWDNIFSVNQIKITMMLLQCARNYKTDCYKPEYIIHECVRHIDIDECTVAVMSVEELAIYSKMFDSFGVKKQQIRKGSYKGIDLEYHQYPYFGFVQFQPIGNRQNFSELQFNLKSKYYNKFKEYSNIQCQTNKK
ncbi:MAG: hypothetical protein HFH14_05815 [Lachnospiraceae bacterium]|nr:hypothetical protein [Lachnospiraceae bacterium]